MTSLSGEGAKTQQKCLFIKEPNLPPKRQLKLDKKKGQRRKGFKISNKRLKISFHYLIKASPPPGFDSVPTY